MCKTDSSGPQAQDGEKLSGAVVERDGQEVLQARLARLRTSTEAEKPGKADIDGTDAKLSSGHGEGEGEGVEDLLVDDVVVDVQSKPQGKIPKSDNRASQRGPDHGALATADATTAFGEGDGAAATDLLELASAAAAGGGDRG